MLLVAGLALLSAAVFAASGRPGDASRVKAGGRTAGRRLARHVARGEAAGRIRETIFARADQYARRVPYCSALDRYLREAGVTSPLSVVMLAGGAAVLLTGVAAAAWRGPGAGLSSALAAAGGGWTALNAIRARRVGRIEAQLPAALDLLVGQLRAHRSIGEAVTDVTQWIAEPLRRECARLAEELRLGVPLRQALERLRDRVPVRAIPAIVTAIAVADRSGANLAEFLAGQSASIRAQIAFHHELRAMTAHARTTGAVLTLLPVAVAGGMIALDPGVFEPMVRTAAGRALLGGAAVMELCGWQVIRTMIRRAEG